MSDKHKIANVFLDERTVVRRSANVEHERKVAIYDLLEKNLFAPANTPDGPYNLHLGIEENRLAFDVRDENDAELTRFTLPLSPLRSIVRDYFLICDSYYKSIQTASPSQIEAIDMGAAACTTRDPKSCANAWPIRWTSTSIRPGACSR